MLDHPRELSASESYDELDIDNNSNGEACNHIQSILSIISIIYYIDEELPEQQEHNKAASCRLIESALSGCFLLYRFFCNEIILLQFFNQVWPLIFEKLHAVNDGQHKVSFTLHFKAEKVNGGGETEQFTFFICKSANMVTDVHKINIYDYYEEKLAKFCNESSKFIVTVFIYIEMRVVTFTPITHRVGHGSMALPQKLTNKKAVINVQNSDDKCFMYAILSVLHYIPSGIINRTSYYVDKMDDINVKDITFPFTIGQLNKFHRNNTSIGVNILQWCEKEGKAKILTPAPLDANRRVINILLVDYNGYLHFVGVPKLDRLLNSANIRSRHYCNRCLQPFSSTAKRSEHLSNCIKNRLQNCIMPKEKYYTFKNHAARISPSHVIYADLESLLIPFENLVNHQAIAAAFIIVPNKKLSEISPFASFYSFVGNNCVKEMLQKIEYLSHEMCEWNETCTRNSMIPLTATENEQFLQSNHCYLCGKRSEKNVRDHDHYTCNVYRYMFNNLKEILIR